MSGNQVLKPILKSSHFVTENVRLSLLSFLRKNELMMTKGGTNLSLGGLQDERIRTIFGTISKRYTWRIVSYLLENGAITSVIARRRLSIPRRSAFRSLSELEEIGLVVMATKTKVPNMEGRPGNVYMLIDAEIDDVRKAARLHNQLFGSRKYRIADDLAQTILEEFNEKGINEIKYVDIRTRVRILKMPFSTYDITKMVSSILMENDLKVWR